MTRAADGPVLGCLVNLYPKTSHSFIRREIAAVEARGARVLRFSIRAPGEVLVDPRDVEELERTTILLARGGLRLAAATAWTALTRPRRFARALGLVRRMARVSERGTLRVLAWLAEACVLRRLLRAGGATHLHAHFGSNPAAVAMLCHAVGGPTWSFTAHGTESFEDPASVSLPLKLREATFAVAVSEWGRRILCELAADRADDIHVVRCGVDRAFLDAAPTPPPAAPTLVCVARISPEKGIDVLVDAVIDLHRAGEEFVVTLVGDGEQRDEYLARLRSCGAGDRLRAVGWGDGAVVRREIEAARALVLPSRGEGLPVVLMEALALQRPAIATDVGAVSELITTGETGWLVPPGDAQQLAAAMRSALAAPLEELTRLGENGRARVHERHDADREAEALLRLVRAHGDGGI